MDRVLLAVLTCLLVVAITLPYLSPSERVE